MSESIPGYDKWKLQAPPEEIIKIEGGVKYTVVYTIEYAFCCKNSCTVYVEQCETLDNEDVFGMLARMKISERTKYVLKGHPEIVVEGAQF